MQRHDSASFAVLNSNHRRLLMLIELLVKDDQPRVFNNDEFLIIGSRPLWLSGIAALDAVGLIEATRMSKCHAIRRSTRWQTITAYAEAWRLYQVALVRRNGLPIMAEKPTECSVA
jgi:hypothetical protein